MILKCRFHNDAHFVQVSSCQIMLIMLCCNHYFDLPSSQKQKGQIDSFRQHLSHIINDKLTSKS